MTEAPLVELRRVSVVYGQADAAVAALDDVTLAVDADERVALRGRSGSGKTTVLHILGGLVEPTSGTVRWRGGEPATLDRAARGGLRGAGVGYVFQGANLLPVFTALENVEFATLATGHSRFAPSELLELVGLAGKRDHLPDELSGGEAQRVALARALAQQPAMLLCDEPTGHLDSDTGTRVLDLLDALQREFGFALVLATHDVDVALRLDREIELRDGRIEEQAA